jgi:phosphohistidine phosphatase SixA
MSHKSKKTGGRRRPLLVFVVRHGEYDSFSGGSLVELGQEQSHVLGNSIKDLVPAKSTVKILSSPIRRALQTAEIIGTILKRRVKILEYLSNDEYHLEPCLVEQLSTIRNFDVLVIVTHLDGVPGVMNHYSTLLCKLTTRKMNIAKGNGLVLDTSTGTVRMIIPE